jgi:GDP-D-mannose dehydratase
MLFVRFLWRMMRRMMQLDNPNDFVVATGETPTVGLCRQLISLEGRISVGPKGAK